MAESREKYYIYEPGVNEGSDAFDGYDVPESELEDTSSMYGSLEKEQLGAYADACETMMNEGGTVYHAPESLVIGDSDSRYFRSEGTEAEKKNAASASPYDASDSVQLVQPRKSVAHVNTAKFQEVVISVRIYVIFIY